MGRCAGIDFGDRRIGVALSDPSGIMAFPHETLEYAGKMGVGLSAVVEALAEFELEFVIVGMPYNMDGTKGRQAERTASFIGELRQRLPEGISVEGWDERLTSVQAGKVLTGAGVKAKEQKGKLDKIAAALILQAWLDHRQATTSDDRTGGRP
jgi:putative holliday junction resolvase